jgi:hypothetical protein
MSPIGAPLVMPLRTPDVILLYLLSVPATVTGLPPREFGINEGFIDRKTARRAFQYRHQTFTV